jgi:hypothetical protein
VATRTLLRLCLAACGWCVLVTPAATAVQLDLSKPGENASEASIATNAAGESIVVWARRDETTGLFTIQAASRQSTTTYKPLGNLSDNHEAAQAPQVAVDQAGNAVAVWQRNDGTGHTVVQATEFTPDGRTIAAPVDLSTPPAQPPHISGQEPEVAIRPDGAGVIVWQEDDYSKNIISIRAAAVAPGGAITSLGEISKPGATGQDDEDPQVAVDQAGDAIAVWAHSDGVNFVVQAAVRPAGAPGFGTPIPVSVPPPTAMEQPQLDAFEPQVAVDQAGDAVVVWTKREGSTADQIIQANSLPAGAAAFTAPKTLSAVGQQSESPQVAVDQGGGAVAAWQRFDGSTTMIDTSTLPAGAPSWNTVTQPSSGVGPPDIAGNPAGDVSAVWSGPNGTGSDIVYTGRLAGGAFGDELRLSTPGQHAVGPQVAVDQAGDAFVVWQRSDGKNTIISTDVPGTPGSGLPFPPGPVGGCVNHPGLPPCPPPKLRLLRLTPGRFSTAGRLVRGHCIAVTPADRSRRRCTRPVSLRVSLTLDAAATVIISTQREMIGRLARRRCVAATGRNRHARRCTRLIALRGRVTGHGGAGANTFVYSRRGLSPGSYRLLVTPRLSGRTGPPASARFTVVN